MLKKWILVLTGLCLILSACENNGNAAAQVSLSETENGQERKRSFITRTDLSERSPILRFASYMKGNTMGSWAAPCCWMMTGPFVYKALSARC